MRFPVLASACLAMACAWLPQATASTVLTGGGSGSLSFITDGTSNTLLFGETTRLSVCFDHVGFGGLTSITDGSSNTIVLGEQLSLTLQAGQVLPRQPISTIADGSSNTIVFGETPPDSLCFAGDTRIIDPTSPPGGISDPVSNTIEFGEDSRFDVCFRNVRVGTIQDGTSNTILIGELSSTPVCYSGVEVADDLRAVATPEPGALGALAMALAGLLALRRRVGA
jgi:hypothetical protein